MLLLAAGEGDSQGVGSLQLFCSDCARPGHWVCKCASAAECSSGSRTHGSHNTCCPNWHASTPVQVPGPELCAHASQLSKVVICSNDTRRAAAADVTDALPGLKALPALRVLTFDANWNLWGSPCERNAFAAALCGSAKLGLRLCMSGELFSVLSRKDLSWPHAMERSLLALSKLLRLSVGGLAAALVGSH